MCSMTHCSRYRAVARSRDLLTLRNRFRTPRAAATRGLGRHCPDRGACPERRTNRSARRIALDRILCWGQGNGPRRSPAFVSRERARPFHIVFISATSWKAALTTATPSSLNFRGEHQLTAATISCTTLYEPRSRFELAQLTESDAICWFRTCAQWSSPSRTWSPNWLA
jgi:hypothetical protein